MSFLRTNAPHRQPDDPLSNSPFYSSLSLKFCFLLDLVLASCTWCFFLFLHNSVPFELSINLDMNFFKQPKSKRTKGCCSFFFRAWLVFLLFSLSCCCRCHRPLLKILQMPEWTIVCIILFVWLAHADSKRKHSTAFQLNATDGNLFTMTCWKNFKHGSIFVFIRWRKKGAIERYSSI